MNIKHLVKYSLSVAALAVAAVSAPAHADIFQDFTVTYGGSTIKADKITGGYSEIFTVTSETTFATSAYATLPVFYKNEGKDFAGVSTNYLLYATFTATGNIVGGGSSFQGTTGTINVFLDKLTNLTDLSLPSVGGAEITRTNKLDDLLLASTSTFKFGTGHNFPGDTNAANGDYSLTFDNFLLTQDGKDYFTSPVPFYLQLTIDGNFGSFPLPDFSNPNPSSIITGAANVTFVPEPGMLGLFGIALLGLGLTRRRQGESAN